MKKIYKNSAAAQLKKNLKYCGYDPQPKNQDIEDARSEVLEKIIQKQAQTTKEDV